jgi:hypothetical protein
MFMISGMWSEFKSVMWASLHHAHPDQIRGSDDATDLDRGDMISSVDVMRVMQAVMGSPDTGYA